MSGLGQSPQDFTAVWGLKVQGDAPFIEVGVEPEEGFLGVRDVLIEGAGVAGRTTARGLDLDHIGTEVAQHLAAEEPHLIGDIQHSVTIEEALTVPLLAQFPASVKSCRDDSCRRLCSAADHLLWLVMPESHAHTAMCVPDARRSTF